MVSFMANSKNERAGIGRKRRGRGCINVDPAQQIREESLCLVKHNHADRRWGVRCQSFTFAPAGPADLGQTSPGSAWQCRIAATCLAAPCAPAAGQSACQAAFIVAIVVEMKSEPAMHCVMFFSRHFYFSDSSPKAVE
jgi:hypothetical protein